MALASEVCDCSELHTGVSRPLDGSESSLPSGPSLKQSSSEESQSTAWSSFAAKSSTS